MTRKTAWFPVRTWKPDNLNDQLRRQFHAVEEHLEGANVGQDQLEDGAVTTPALGDGSVTDAKVSDITADKISGGTLRSTVLVDGSLANAASGQRTIFDATGLHFVDDSGNILMELPISGEAFVRAAVEASGLLVEGKMTIRDEGTDEGHLIEPGAKVTLGGAAAGSSIADPSVKPALSMIWEKTTLGSGTTQSASRTGLFYDSSNTSWWTTQETAIYEFDLDGTFIRSKEISNANGSLYGVARVGTRVYVLFRDLDTDLVLKTYQQSDLSFLDQINVESKAGVSMTEPVALGDDGTNVIVVDTNASNILRFHKFTRADEPAFVSTTTSSGTGNPTFGANEGPSGFVNVSSEWWVSTRKGNVYSFSTAGVYNQNKEFPSEGGTIPLGVTHDGTVFWTQSKGGTWITKHTNWTWTTESAKYWVAYTWVDDNGAASAGSRPLGAGDFESKKSPTNSITMYRRARLRITVGTFPAGMTHAGIYVDRGAAEPTLDFVADTADRTEDLTSFTAGGSAPPGTSNLPSGNNATLQASDGAGGYVALLRSNGMPRCIVEYTAGSNVANDTDTYISFGTEITDTDNFYATTTDALDTTPDASEDFTLPFDGQYLVVVSANYSIDPNNRRELFVQLNGVGFRRMTYPTVASVQMRMGFTEVIPAAAADTLRFGTYHNAGGPLALNNYRVSIIYLGPAT